VLFIDLETYSELDIKTAAIDRYASHPSTRILMCAYADEQGPVKSHGGCYESSNL